MIAENRLHFVVENCSVDLIVEHLFLDKENSPDSCPVVAVLQLQMRTAVLAVVAVLQL